ncbi:MAG TPA: PQQ-binding-like beta-propeller repeat protein [Mycobacteriales bacterium]|nr:PQQ-binding-like beta-propeller repeat protein [Mycobacteriales bacterium]
MGGRPLRVRIAALAGALAMGMAAPAAHAHAARPWHAALNPAGPSCNWPMFGQNPARTFTTQCQEAPDPTNVGRLLPRWYFHANDVITASPAIVDGTVYVGAWDGTFYALDFATGKVLWKTTLGTNRTDGHPDHHTGAYGIITSSAAVATVGHRRLVFVGGGDTMWALDASRRSMPDRRRVVWAVNLDPKHPTSDGEIESSPVVWSGAKGGPVVIFGSDANQDSGYTGEGMWELRAATGRLVFHFNPETYLHHSLYGCGNVWSSPALALDPNASKVSRRAMLYFGTADCPDNGNNPCPSDGSDQYCRPGGHYDYRHRWTRLSQAILAISAVTGKPVWSYQPFPRNDISDDDFGASAQLFTLPSGRQVVGEANKSGSYYVVDRHTGKPLWNRPETGNGNLQAGFALGGLLGSTAVLPVSATPTVFGGAAINTPVYFNERAGEENLQPPASIAAIATPLVGFSGTTGAHVWSAVQAPTYSPTTAANGVVYSGAVDDVLRAYDAQTGAILWAFPLTAPISSGAAVTANGLVIGAGTSESDVEFKTCDNLPGPLQEPCKATPLNATLNPLSKANGIWAFSLSSPS